MEKNKDFDTLKNDVLKDLDECKSKDLNNIYKALKTALKTFDRDGLWKNIKDVFRSLFKSKKEKCALFIADICDSKELLNEAEKETLRKSFLDISNIHRTFLEDLQSLFGAL